MTILHHLRKPLHTMQHVMFDYLVLILHAFYIITFFGLSIIAPQYLDNFDYFLKVYVSVFLVLRFNPFRDHVIFTALDKKVVFSAAMMLLISTILTPFYNKYVQNALDKAKAKAKATVTNTNI